MQADRLPGFRISNSVLLALETLFAISFLIMILSPAGPSPEGNLFLTIGTHTYPGRKIGYFFFLACTLLISFSSSQAAFQRVFEPKKAWVEYMNIAAVALLAAYAFLFESSVEVSILSVAVFFLVVQPKILYSKAVRTALVLVLVFLTGVEIFPVFIAHIDLSSLLQFPDTLADAEAHTAFVLTGPAEKLAFGSRLFDDVQPSYGLLFPAALAALERLLGILDWGQLIFATVVSQFLFLVIAAAVYLAYTQRSLPLTLLATALLMPSFTTFGTYLLYPQASALRYYGFLCAAAYMVFARGRLRALSHPVFAGLVSGFSLLLNLETGFCVLLGLLAYSFRLHCKGFRIGSFLAVAGFAAGNILAFLLFEIFFALAFGYFPSWHGWYQFVLVVLQKVSSGKTAQGTLTFVPLVSIMVCHAAFVFINGWKQLGKTDAQAIRTGIATMLLVWFLYYFNNPGGNSLSANWFLYLFFFVDLVRALHTRWVISSPNAKAVMLATVICVGQSSALRYQHGFIRRAGNSYNLQAGQATRLVSGIYLPVQWVPEILSRANRIREESRHGPVYYLTMNPVLIASISKVSSSVPLTDIYFSLYSRQSMDPLLNYLRLHADKVFVDTPNLHLGGAVRNLSIVSAIRNLLKGDFQLQSTEDGWQIWIKRKVQQTLPAQSAHPKGS